jgi:hypothetical protein
MKAERRNKILWFSVEEWPFRAVKRNPGMTFLAPQARAQR